MSFNAFINIAQPAGSNSCGAFALAALLQNFGLQQQNQQAYLLNTENMASGYTQPGPEVSYNNDPLAFAQSIYQVTGILNTDATNAVYQYLNPVSDMNPPSALVYIATLFGYPPDRITVQYNNAGMNMFSSLHVTNAGAGGTLLNTEITLLAGINDAGNMIIAGPVNYSNRPNNTQLQMILVDNGTHWIALNSTQLYDPGTGEVGSYTDPVDNGGVWSCTCPGTNRTYDFSGIWIQLRIN
ncbi:hypothetical protein [Mucilaginibacter paludis]|uniref:Peptidase C39-like domain-containing protein n=1 Tax=Mucilaginibacter paludis DSM 18603 TaxID=714943 RepID=H1Y6C1_9SPHI|nr:hypothetical protein [Mucilaginibacter paludis]EHQ24869.1 hypothetical protein Mucpa_0687 [Mucilaginibacter paludis DSM 18603]